MSWFTLKKGSSRRDVELSMAGLKMGSTVLQVGDDDPSLIAALAKLVGLSGRACAVAASDEAREQIARAADKAGVLVEFKPGDPGDIPFEEGTFDLVVLKNLLGSVSQNERVRCLQQVFRVLRIGGRCLVIDSAIRGGLGAVLSKRSLDARYLERGARASLDAEGFRGVRQLADRDGLVFVEGVKPRPAQE